MVGSGVGLVAQGVPVAVGRRLRARWSRWPKLAEAVAVAVLVAVVPVVLAVAVLVAVVLSLGLALLLAGLALVLLLAGLVAVAAGVTLGVAGRGSPYSRGTAKNSTGTRSPSRWPGCWRCCSD